MFIPHIGYVCLVSAVYNSNLQLQKLGFLLLYSNYVIYYKPDLKKQMVYLLRCVFFFFLPRRNEWLNLKIQQQRNQFENKVGASQLDGLDIIKQRPPLNNKSGVLCFTGVTIVKFQCPTWQCLHVVRVCEANQSVCEASQTLTLGGILPPPPPSFFLNTNIYFNNLV